MVDPRRSKGVAIMSKFQQGYMEALDDLRALVKDLDAMVEGGREQVEAVIAANELFQNLTSHARMELSDIRHGR